MRISSLPAIMGIIAHPMLLWAAAGVAEEIMTASSTSSRGGEAVIDVTAEPEILDNSDVDKEQGMKMSSPEEALARTVTYGERQGFPQDKTQKQQTNQRLLEVDKYMHETVFQDESYKKVAKRCLNRHRDCTFWAAIGECEANRAYMAIHCAPACLSCDQLIFEKRCPLDENLEDIWKGGDLNRFFERITTEPYYQQYKPITVVSRPAENDNDNDMPWIVTLDNFLTEQECQALIELGAAQGYERSSDVGDEKFDGTFDSHVNEGRTSRNAWCLDACYHNATTQQVLAKIENLTAIPDANSEYLQLLKYEEGQFYQSHHDYIEFHLRRNQGVRILTVFLYLNDVEAGGGTRFTDLDFVVEPKRGKALIWPSVLNQDPNEKDHRTHHEAMPVKQGVKYGANAWIHVRDFKTPYAKSCT